MLELLKNGDPEAFRQFYYQWDERLYFYFLKKVKEESCAHELSQLTFIKMWKYRSALSDQCTLEVQLFRKAKLIYIDWLRKEAVRRKQKEAEIAYTNEPAPDHGANTVHPKTEKLQNALEQLPPMRRKVIELSHLHGYAYKEIAQKLNISIKTVDNHISQALKQLRKILSLFFL